VAIAGCPPLVSHFTIWHNFVRLTVCVVAIFTVAWVFVSFLNISEVKYFAFELMLFILVREQSILIYTTKIQPLQKKTPV